MYQFFTQKAVPGQESIRLEDGDVNHIKNVLRMKPYEKIKVTNPESGYSALCEIREINEDNIICQVLEEGLESTELPAMIYLFQGLPKADKMELIIQKTVELGVYKIIPVAMKRCVVKIEPKKEEAKRKRWQAIAEAAAKQSKRMVIPEVLEVMSYAQALNLAKDMDLKLLPYECAEGMEKTRKLIKTAKPGDRIAVFIGPEGGFDEREVEQAFSEGIEPVTLGKRILRTETAGFTTLAYLSYELEE